MTSLTLFAIVASACYSTGDGIEPPPNEFYYPVGLAVSSGGGALYAVNSNFDLQWNAGTIQAYNLHLVRKHALIAIRDPKDPALPLAVAPNQGTCPGSPAERRIDNSPADPLETCAPVVRSSFYVRDSAHVGAFATDLQILDGRRLFFPVRGNATLSWVDVTPDDPTVIPPDEPNAAFPPFQLDCGSRQSGRCSSSHESGANPNEPGNSRHLTMPGEPFGLAISEDGTAAIVTHQTDTRASLFSTGLSRTNTNRESPSLQFVLENVPIGGNGVAAIPHCLPQPDGTPCASTAPRPSFLLTSRASRELSLLRYYADDASGGASIRRPFLRKEGSFSLEANIVGTDSRGVAIDTTKRLACLAKVAPAVPPRTPADVATETAKCNEIPARVFIANRSPASLVYGDIGTRGSIESAPNPDRVVISGSIPLSVGPSRVYLAPIVDRNGNYALRVFVVCFDAAMVYVIDPELRTVENIIRVAPGPYALAFDPFSWQDVAIGAPALVDPRDAAIKKYRFAYLASFTQSFVQLIDLDAASDHPEGFQSVVLQLGKPTNPKGSF